MTSNMEQNERFNHGVIGVIVLLGGLLNFHPFIWMLLGVALIAEAFMGWCSIPWVRDYLKNKMGSSS